MNPALYLTIGNPLVLVGIRTYALYHRSRTIGWCISALFVVRDIDAFLRLMYTDASISNEGLYGRSYRASRLV